MIETLGRCAFSAQRTALDDRTDSPPRWPDRATLDSMRSPVPPTTIAVPCPSASGAILLQPSLRPSLVDDMRTPNLHRRSFLCVRT